MTTLRTEHFTTIDARVTEILHDAAQLYATRTAEYAGAWLDGGEVLRACLDAAFQTTMTEAAGVQTYLVAHLASKLSRFAARLPTGGHIDSARDMVVYAAMLQAISEHIGKAPAPAPAPAPRHWAETDREPGDDDDDDDDDIPF